MPAAMPTRSTTSTVATAPTTRGPPFRGAASAAPAPACSRIRRWAARASAMALRTRSDGIAGSALGGPGAGCASLDRPAAAPTPGRGLVVFGRAAGADALPPTGVAGWPGLAPAGVGGWPGLAPAGAPPVALVGCRAAGLAAAGPDAGLAVVPAPGGVAGRPGLA